MIVRDTAVIHSKIERFDEGTIPGTARKECLSDDLSH